MGLGRQAGCSEARLKAQCQSAEEGRAKATTVLYAMTVARGGCCAAQSRPMELRPCGKRQKRKAFGYEAGR